MTRRTGWPLVAVALVWIVTVGRPTPCLGWQGQSSPRPAAKKAPAEPLDQQLLDDLPPAGAKPAAKSPSATSPQPRPDAKPNSSNTPRETGKPDEGEDIELVDPAALLRDLQARMRTVELRLRDQDFSRSTQSEQGRIAAELESFIRQLQRRQGAGQLDKTGGSGTASDQSGGGAPQPTTGRTQESVDQENTRPPLGDDGEALATAMPGVWGQLPTQLRQQLQSLATERFLPRYERLIQQYYRRLGEPAER